MQIPGISEQQAYCLEKQWIHGTCFLILLSKSLHSAVQKTAEFQDFFHAKTLVLFRDGVCCGRSLTKINHYYVLGCPPERLKWYRGGIQNLELLGLIITK